MTRLVSKKDLLVVQNASSACREDEWTNKNVGGAETLSSKDALVQLAECPVRLRRGSSELTSLLPILFTSPVAAGVAFSHSNDEMEQRLSLDELLIKNAASTFFVRAVGDSMKGCGICSGDILVVDRAREARSGSIVVVALDGELAVKRYVTKDAHTFLVSENPQFAPLLLTEGRELHIWGVVVASVTQFAP